MRPFKPPTLSSRTPSQGIDTLQAPPAKKRRISRDVDDDVAATIEAANQLKRPPPPKKFSLPPRKRLVSIQNVNSSWQSDAPAGEQPESYYLVVWRKFTMKKNKTWDGDGVLSIVGTAARLQDDTGKELGRGVCKIPLLVGSELSVGGKDVEINDMISKQDYLAGRPFVGARKPAPAPPLEEVNETTRVTHKEQAKHNKLAVNQKERLVESVTTSKASKGAFKNPLQDKTVLVPRKDSKVPVPRHDPNVEGALVMKRPKSTPKDKQIVDVVVDPLLTKVLRPHQREGVSFMYECVMGMKGNGGEGAILADEMGLGKTIQTIALLWTLLKQNPIHEEPPVVKKALIVCPVTLISNWRKEIRKWLGDTRIGVFILENKKTRLTDFTRGRAYQVMIIGYEKLTKVQDELQKAIGIDIVIADEGHRLKTEGNKAAQAIKSLNTERRIILSGTPLQNDLTEFYTMVDFVNPGMLGKSAAFKREFETPIIKSRQPEASRKEMEKGEARSQELADITDNFILRRTSDLLAAYLPPKTEYVLFCRLTAAQTSIYRAIVGSPLYSGVLGSSALQLELINVLKKICNNPTLLARKGDKGEELSKPELLEIIPPGLLRDNKASGKLQVLEALLHQIRSTTEEKVVLVSNYTSTMDVLETLMAANSWKMLRLDGSTPANKRQDLVDRFNRSPPSSSFVFLLSAKAGGTGINLIGASRLILFDMDWNPATDLQAMARVHRDGQKRPCFIYRFLTQGALDEKIFQRQVSKMGLADAIVDGKAAMSGFTREELRDLFTLDEGEDCQTHRLTGCDCGGNGMAHASLDDVPKSSVYEEGIEVVRLDDDNDAEEDTDSYVSKKITTKLKNEDIAAIEAEHQRKRREHRDSTGKAKMLSLMQYTHFDTALMNRSATSVAADLDDSDDEMLDDNPCEPIPLIMSAVEDAALRNVIRGSGGRVGYVFAKRSALAAAS